MKHSKHFTLTLLVLIFGLLYTQNSFSQKEKYYYQGIKMFNKNQFEKAQSFFKLALNTYKAVDPDSTYYFNMNSYYYLALTQFQLNDSCDACKNLMSCFGGYGYPVAGKLYDSLCFLKRKINYNKSFCPESKCYSESTSPICENNFRSPSFFIDHINQGSGCSFYLADNNSVLENESQSSSFDITTIPPDKIIFNWAEEMPEFPGGDSSRIKFFVENFKHPQSAKDYDFQGKIYVSFIIEADGSVSNIELLRGIGKMMDDEAIRVLKLMPKWKPAKCCGIPVRFILNMPIVFSEKE